MDSSDEVDLVNHPPHYTFGRFEVKDVLASWFSHEALHWQIGKYIARCRHKGRMKEDLEKARFYAREVQRLEREHPGDHHTPRPEHPLGWVLDDWLPSDGTHQITGLRLALSSLYESVIDGIFFDKDIDRLIWQLDQLIEEL